jgi:fucose permease
VTAVGILLAGLAPVWIALAAALLVAGAMDGITDVAQNSHGLRVQRLYQRSVLNSFHALWSIGAVIGGLMGTAAAGLGVPLAVHLSISAVVFAGVAIGAYRFLLPGPEPVEIVSAPSVSTETSPVRVAHRYAKFGVIGALAIIAAAGALVEDAGSSWSAVYLTGSLDATASVAGLGFVSLVAAQFVGRLIGDRVIDRFGPRTTAIVGGLIAAIGMGTALAFPSVIGTIVGFGAAGFGVATVIPTAMHAADELPGFTRGTGLTIVTWLLRLGFLLSPPIVGAVADSAGLRTGLLVVPLAGILIVFCSPVLAKRLRPHG